MEFLFERKVRSRMHNASNSLQGSIHPQASESFNQLSRRGQCAFMALSSLLSVTKGRCGQLVDTVIDQTLPHGDSMYLHALSSNLVLDRRTLNVKI